MALTQAAPLVWPHLSTAVSCGLPGGRSGTAAAAGRRRTTSATPPGSKSWRPGRPAASSDATDRPGMRRPLVCLEPRGGGYRTPCPSRPRAHLRPRAARHDQWAQVRDIDTWSIAHTSLATCKIKHHNTHDMRVIGRHDRQLQSILDWQKSIRPHLVKYFPLPKALYYGSSSDRQE